MAAERVNSMTVTVMKGHEVFPVTLESPEPVYGDKLTVGDLATELEKMTCIPVAQQKLIFKGRTLNSQGTPLINLGIKHGSKVMLIGSKVVLDPNMKVMQEVESDLATTGKNLSTLIAEVVQARKQRAATVDSIAVYTRRLAGCAEELTRYLEKLDALVLASASDDVKARRKKLVCDIQNQLDQTDNLKSSLGSS